MPVGPTIGVGGDSSGGSISTVEVEEQQQRNAMLNVSSSVEVSSYPDYESELELGLGLSLGGGGGGGGVGKLHQQQVVVPRILTAKDLNSKLVSSRPLALTTSPLSSPSSSSSFSGDGVKNLICDNESNSSNVSAGTKRTADSVTSPPRVSQVVGWPPIRSYRMNNLANQAKSVAIGELNSTTIEGKSKEVVYCTRDEHERHHTQRGRLKGSSFVKVTMDGVGIGRKVELSAHSCYESMALTLDDMFTSPNRVLDGSKSSGEVNSAALGGKRIPKLLDGSSDYVLTYEDKDGDWMLVGDVPWCMFLGSVKRLRIMKTSEAKGLAPRCEAQSGNRSTHLI